jgi:hypothetical protein
MCMKHHPHGRSLRSVLGAMTHFHSKFTAVSYSDLARATESLHSNLLLDIEGVGSKGMRRSSSDTLAGGQIALNQQTDPWCGRG